MWRASTATLRCDRSTIVEGSGLFKTIYIVYKDGSPNTIWTFVRKLDDSLMFLQKEDLDNITFASMCLPEGCLGYIYINSKIFVESF